MPFSFWPFGQSGRSADEEIIGSLPNTADSKTVQLKQTKGEGHEEGTLSPSLFDNTRRSQLVAKTKDARFEYIDPESIDCIVKRYSSEMTVADRIIKEKKQNQDSRVIHFYDYEGDRRYQQWLADQQRVRERLQIHWIDMVIDKPPLCLKYLARVTTTVGMFYGFGRSAYLYRTMDKMYAKLHGVSFFQIALYEVSLSIVKGAAVSVAGMMGVVAGEAGTNLAVSFATDDVSVPDRSWYNVWVCGTTGGLFSGAAFAAMHTSSLSLWGVKAIVAGFTSLGSFAGLGLGYKVYRPYAAKREKRIYDPYWRPWQERKLNQAGGTYVRGKYM